MVDGGLRQLLGQFIFRLCPMYILLFLQCDCDQLQELFNMMFRVNLCITYIIRDIIL